uniref:Uncharacterized protein n=1 Tax=Steinernema glaseri TaxID=37863 RepID=A0A1I7ZMX9_9BILA
MDARSYGTISLTVRTTPKKQRYRPFKIFLLPHVPTTSKPTFPQHLLFAPSRCDLSFPRCVDFSATTTDSDLSPLFGKNWTRIEYLFSDRILRTHFENNAIVG